MVNADHSRRPRRVSLDIKISLDEIPPMGLKLSLQASEVELTDLATWLDVPRIDMLSAEFDVTWEKDGEGVVISGPLKAQLTQTCVVTLEPLETVIDAPTRVRYRHVPDEEDQDWEFSPDAPDQPEIIVEGIIDLGEMVAQQLALEIDPFPRAPGVPYQDVSTDKEEGRPHPFSALASLRDKLSD
jgi:uncharacterized metal-binding protein YceD (DUF177 family)